MFELIENLCKINKSNNLIEENEMNANNFDWRNKFHLITLTIINDLVHKSLCIINFKWSKKWSVYMRS